MTRICFSKFQGARFRKRFFVFGSLGLFYVGGRDFFYVVCLFCIGCDFCTLGHHIQCGPDALSAIWVGRLIKTCSGAKCAAVSDYAPRRLRVVGVMCRRKNPILLWHGFNKEGMSSAAV